MVQGLNWYKGSNGPRVQTFKGSNGSSVKMVQGFKCFKG